MSGGLTVSRKPGESLEMTGGIKVIIKAVHGKRVHVCVQAPKETAIWRSELRLEPEAISEVQSAAPPAVEP